MLGDFSLSLPFSLYSLVSATRACCGYICAGLQFGPLVRFKSWGKTHFQSETADTAKCQCGTVAMGQKLQTEHGKLLKKIFQMQERMETKPVQPGWGTFFQLMHEDVTFELAKVNLRY